MASQGNGAFDRYAYVNNNPVKYNDPTGHDVGCAGLDAAGCPSYNTLPSANDVQLQIDTSNYQKAADYAVGAYRLSVGTWPIYNPAIKDGMENGVKVSKSYGYLYFEIPINIVGGPVEKENFVAYVGASAYDSAGDLGSTIEHEAKVHYAQNTNPKVNIEVDLESWYEVQAYAWESQNLEKFNINDQAHKELMTSHIGRHLLDFSLNMFGWGGETQ